MKGLHKDFFFIIFFLKIHSRGKGLGDHFGFLPDSMHGIKKFGLFHYYGSLPILTYELAGTNGN